MQKIKRDRERKAREKKTLVAKEKRARAITERVNQRVNYDFNRLTRHTAASARAILTAEQLDNRSEVRRTSAAHDTNVHSNTGAEFSRGRTYTFAKASGLRVPKWRRGV